MGAMPSYSDENYCEKIFVKCWNVGATVIIRLIDIWAAKKVFKWDF